MKVAVDVEKIGYAEEAEAAGAHVADVQVALIACNAADSHCTQGDWRQECYDSAALGVTLQ